MYLETFLIPPFDASTSYSRLYENIKIYEICYGPPEGN